MTDDRIMQVEQAIAEAEAQGLAWTNRHIYERVGGNYEALAAYLKQRRAQAPSGETTAVAVEEPPAPERPPVLASPRTPLSQARWERNRTHQAEHALGLQEQGLKTERRTLEEAVQVETYHVGRQTSDTMDLAARQRLQELRTQLLQVEAQRLAVHQQRREAFAAKLAAADAYDSVHGQAARWLRRLRDAQRRAQAGTTAQARGDAREEGELALEELARLVGQTEAHALADDPTLQPDWGYRRYWR